MKSMLQFRFAALALASLVFAQQAVTMIAAAASARIRGGEGNNLDGDFLDHFDVQSKASSDEWEKYQCDLPMEERRRPVGCFCGFLKDRRGPGAGLLADEAVTADRFSVTKGDKTELTDLSNTKLCSNGSNGQFPCSNIDLHAFIPLSVFDTEEVNDVWGWTDEESGREFAIVGMYDGMGFVEITNPANPIFLGKVWSRGSMFRDVKVYQHYAMTVAEAAYHGLRVFDLKRLLTINNSNNLFFTDASYRGFYEAHNLVINEETGYAYVVGSDQCDGGLFMVDLSNPLSPTYAGCYADDGYVHDAQCLIYQGADQNYVGREICFCSNEDTITIVDVTDKKNPIQLSRTKYKTTGYTHQGWLSEDQSYFVFGDEFDETNEGFNTRTLVMNVISLTRPFLAGEHFGATNAIDHNLYTKDGLAYLANYQAGLRILRMDDVSTAKFTEVGFFDTYPMANEASFNGAWSVYPYFKSGTVIVTSIEQGLFILRPDLEKLNSACNQDVVCDPGESCNACPFDCQCTGEPSPSPTSVPSPSPSVSVVPSLAAATLSPAPSSEPTKILFQEEICAPLLSGCSSHWDCCSGLCRRRRCVRHRRLGEVVNQEETEEEDNTFIINIDESSPVS